MRHLETVTFILKLKTDDTVPKHAQFLSSVQEITPDGPGEIHHFFLFQRTEMRELA